MDATKLRDLAAYLPIKVERHVSTLDDKDEYEWLQVVTAKGTFDFHDDKQWEFIELLCEIAKNSNG